MTISGAAREQRLRPLVGVRNRPAPRALRARACHYVLRPRSTSTIARFTVRDLSHPVRGDAKDRACSSLRRHPPRHAMPPADRRPRGCRGSHQSGMCASSCSVTAETARPSCSRHPTARARRRACRSFLPASRSRCAGHAAIASCHGSGLQRVRELGRARQRCGSSARTRPA